jgi:hypothetical protein
MAAVKNLWVDLQGSRFINGIRDASAFSWGPIYHNENLNLALRFLKTNQDGALADRSNPMSLVNISGAALTVKVWNSAGDTLLAQQTVWVVDGGNSILSGALDLYTVPMIAAIGSSASITTKLEITLVLSDGTYTIRNDSLTIYRAFNITGTPAPAPGTNWLTLEQALGIFLRQVNEAGVTLTLTSPDGTKQRVLGIDDYGSGTDSAQQ